MTPFADLHCHSYFSDGTLSPKEIAEKAIEKKLQGVTITDHDTIEGAKILEPIAKELGLEFLYGVEFSSSFEGESIHILGYGFDPNAPSIDGLCRQHIARREKRNRAIIEKLHSFDIHIDYEKMVTLSSGIIGRPHIARQLIEKGIVGTMQEAFQVWLGDGKKAFAQVESPTILETISAIHAASGFAILAHPQLISKRFLLPRILKFSFDGVEAWYGVMGKERALPYVKMAKDRGWIITGGSDFHGEGQRASTYGSSTTDEENFRRLQKSTR